MDEIDRLTQTLRENKRAIDQAETMTDMAFDAAKELPKELRQKYWEILYLRVAEWACKIGEPEQVIEPRPLSEGAMNEKESKRFGLHSMPFGKHEGEEIRDVPLSYLFWLDGDQFRQDLHRYLLSDRVQREQD